MLSCFSRIWLFVTLWAINHQVFLSMGFSRQEYQSGLLCPPPGDLPDPGIEPASLTYPALADRFFTSNATWEAPTYWAPAQGLALPVVHAVNPLPQEFTMWGLDGVWEGWEALWGSDVDHWKHWQENREGSLLPSKALKYGGKNKWTDKQVSDVLLVYLSFCSFSIQVSQSLHPTSSPQPNPRPLHKVL